MSEFVVNRFDYLLHSDENHDGLCGKMIHNVYWGRRPYTPSSLYNSKLLIYCKRCDCIQLWTAFFGNLITKKSGTPYYNLITKKSGTPYLGSYRYRK